MEKSDTTLLRLARLRHLTSTTDGVNDDLSRLMSTEDLDVIASERITSKPRTMTAGADGMTRDGFSWEAMHESRGALRTEQVPCKPVRTAYVPTPKGKMRTLGLPCTRDTVVQEGMRMIRAALYASPHGPYFPAARHGVRPQRRCPTALRESRGTWAAPHWFSAGDVPACFDSVAHRLLVSLLRQKIKDERVLTLIGTLRRAGDRALRGQRGDSLAGTPQGSLASPLLATVSLPARERTGEEMRQRREKGDKKRRHPLHRKLSAVRQRLRKRGQTHTPELRALVRPIRTPLAVVGTDPEVIPIKDIRYAADGLLGVCGPRSLADQSTEELRAVLAAHLPLTRSADKTGLPPARSAHAPVWGTQICIGRGGGARGTPGLSTAGTAIKRRTTGGETVRTAPVASLITRRQAKGLCTARGDATTTKAWLSLDAEQIVALYSSSNRGRQNDSRCADNVAHGRRIQHSLRFSLARTRAAKFKISVNRVLRRVGPAITLPVKARDGKRDRQVSCSLTHDSTKERTAFTTHDAAVDLVGVAVRFRTRSQLGQPSCVCGSPDHGEMHHVRHLRTRDGKKATGFTAVLRAVTRKHVPVCVSCHRKIQRGEDNGMRVSALADAPRTAVPTHGGGSWRAG